MSQPPPPLRDPVDVAAARFGLRAAIATGVSTLVTFAHAIATPPRSGALCTGDCFTYPFDGIESRFPRDYGWMFAAITATLLFVALAVALADRAPPARRLTARLGLVLAAMAALVLVGDYFLQLAVIQPSLLAGERDGLALLNQYNEHGVFIALEELGYLLVILSLVCLAAGASGASRVERALRWLVGVGFLAVVALLAYVLAAYGHGRGYRFELAVISIDWLVLIAASFLAAALFCRDLRNARLIEPLAYLNIQLGYVLGMGTQIGLELHHRS
jgi:hypothetical protein